MIDPSERPLAGAPKAPAPAPAAPPPGFAARLARRKTPATLVLLVANLAMYALEVARSGFEPTVGALIALGGNSPRHVFAGEVWRLISSAFLHGSVMHVGFNMLVLWVLGRFVERLMGTARFLILYTGAAIAGSIASVLVTQPSVSVGASGALWGILAAHAVFAFTPGFLPPAFVRGARRAALWNLGLNVMVSFVPHVDWAAHFGGGLVGAALVFFVLLRGLPKGDALANEGPRANTPMKAAAGVSALVLAVGAAMGPLLG